MGRSCVIGIIALLLVCLTTSPLQAQTGQWKAYMSYAEPTEIVEADNNILYVLASDNLYSYNRNDKSIQTYDKVNALSDCEISHIAWSQAAKRLVIVYSNYNIDLLDANMNVINMPEYLNKVMTSDKTVNDIYINGSNAYLSTGFGIMKLDVANALIADTYQLGFNVAYSYIEGEYLYAASPSEGLYRGLLTDNLLDKSNWSRVGDYVANDKTIDSDLLAEVNTLQPGGPKYNHFGYMVYKYGKLYTVPGGHTAFQDLEYKGAIQILNNDEWEINDEDLKTVTGHKYIDLSAIDINPLNKNQWFAGGRTGLYQFINGLYKREYTPDNSALRGAATVSATSKDYNFAKALCFDENGHLWVGNSISATTSLLEYDPTSDEWTSHHSTELMQDGRAWDNMIGMMFDSRKLLWFVNDHSNNPAVAVYNPSTDELITYRTFINEDNTTLDVYYVRCIAEDLEGNMWIGTNVGPVILAPDQFSETNPVFEQVKVPRDDGTNLADYLLANVDIKGIAVDKANRKWFATNGNGVYCISADNLEQIHHFTSDNSKLLSDYVNSIAINDSTGEVFFGTDKGLCSYVSDATQPVEEMDEDSVVIYPNPVKPDFTGVVTINGLSSDADVKIVTSNGVLVNEGRSNGGTYVWDVCDMKGKRVASGVYMVMVATSEGKKGVVCKIAVIN